MSKTSRRSLLCALPALPFIARACIEPKDRTVQVVVRGNIGFDKDFIDKLVEDISAAANGRDVVVYKK